MRILGIETSCDETAIALVDGVDESVSVLSSTVLSQIQEHAQYGGVVPEVAARKHLEAIFPMLSHELPHDGEGIDVIAVTAGPGLAPALRTGVEVAKTLAWIWKKPLVPVSHLEGHIYAAWFTGQPVFPALCLLVSGGHTEFIFMKGHGRFERIGETYDDAAGEAFDKVAKMLKLGYPGGPAIAKLAEQGNKQAFDFPRGLLDRPTLDFSFSGIKTSVLYTLRKLETDVGAGFSLPVKADIAASFQEAVVDVLAKKTRRAILQTKPASLVLAGGVSANKELRLRLEEVAEDLRIPFHVPPFEYSMDNAAMIAAAGYFRGREEKNWRNPVTVEADPNLEIA